MSDPLPRAWVVGIRARGKLGCLRVRLACGICYAGPLEACDEERHDEIRALMRKHSWPTLWRLLAYSRRSEDVILPGVHPWPATE